MQTKIGQLLGRAIILPILLMAFSPGPVAAAANPGFLVLAPDRGFMGNNEIRDVYAEFQQSQVNVPSQLVFASSMGLATYLTDALQALESENATEIVLIPLFLSESDPDLARARNLLAPDSDSAAIQNEGNSIKLNLPLVFAPTMSASYLTAQILADRAAALSETPSAERLIVIGAGAVDRDEAATIRDELQKLTDQVQRKLGFKETHIFVYHRRNSAEGTAVRREIGQEIRRLAALDDKTIAVPFFISMKLTPMMSVESMLGQYSFRGMDILYGGQSILPHANVARWLKKTANSYLPVEKENIGIVFMNHGSFYYYNEKVRRAVRPVEEQYKLEYAMSMGDPFLIQEAVDRLEARGATHIVLLRAFSLSTAFKAKVEYILGLTDTPPAGRRMARVPDRVRSGALLYTAGGVDDSPLYAEVLLERALAISKDPQNETVILVAHGLGDDAGDERWKTLLRSLGAQMQELAADKFKEIKVGTWREDWPNKTEQAVEEVETLIQQARQNGGRVLLVAARLEGNDPGDELIEDLDIPYNEDGFSGHPKFSQWIVEEVEAAVANIQGR